MNKKLFYATSLSFPSRYANRLQILQTAEALGLKLKDAFVLGCNHVTNAESLYTHRLVNFCSHRSPVVAFKQLMYVRKHRFSVVYSREYTILFAMMLYNKIFRVACEFILEVHDFHQDVRFGFVLRRCAHVFCLTGNLRDDLVNVFGLRLPPTVLPDGVNLEVFNCPVPKEILRSYFELPADVFIATYVGSVGVHDWKGVDIFLSSIISIHDTRVWYIVAGVRDRDIPILEKKYRGKQVRFYGWLKRSDVVKMMHLSDVLVLPNKSGSTNSERYTSPMKLFEYMASSVPIVASDLPSIREVLNEGNAVLVPPNDAFALARGVEEILRDRPLADRISKQARSEVSRYTWDARVKKILTEIENLYESQSRTHRMEEHVV